MCSIKDSRGVAANRCKNPHECLNARHHWLSMKATVQKLSTTEQKKLEDYQEQMFRRMEN